MTQNISLDGKSLDIPTLATIARSRVDEVQLSLSSKSLELMQTSRDYVLKIVELEKPVYGINTGFGALSEKFMSKDKLDQLQINLVRSHCTGVGEAFDRETTRAIMVLRANCLASGFSGVNPELVQRLIDYINLDIIPFVPEKGSVGASGDLAPLSHIALTLMGEGKVFFENKLSPTKEVLQKLKMKPCKLGPKDGLALINGTAVMAALGSLALNRAWGLIKTADIVAAVTNEAVRGTDKAYDLDISRLKPHMGQQDVASNLKKLLTSSEIRNSHENCTKVQDPYSLRCIPQVHGACRQTLRHAEMVLEIEINSVTDNPLVFADEEKVISGGNFHGEAIAMAMDYLAIGLAELCNISERRIEKMMNPTFSDLPHFLTKDSGLNSGLMIAHVTSAALTSENKVLCHPASIDSIPTSTDKEDHVSMGITSGLKLKTIVQNLQYCLAIELLCNTQAINLLRPLKSNTVIEKIMTLVHSTIEPIGEDRVFHDDILAMEKLIARGKILKTAEEELGEIL